MRPLFHEPRDNRHRYDGRVRLIVQLTPWRLVGTLTGKDISASGLAAFLPVKGNSAGVALEALLALGDPYDLQIEHDQEHLPAPLARARLVRRRDVAGGVELGFSFEEPDADLLSLLHELGGGDA
jgi:hypothetical protein